MVMFKIEADYELLNYYDTIRKKQTKPTISRRNNSLFHLDKFEFDIIIILVLIEQCEQ